MNKLVVGLVTVLVVILGGVAIAQDKSKPIAVTEQPVVAADPLPEPEEIKQPPTEQELLELVNAERAKVGVKPLKLHPNIQKTAQLKASDMATRDYYNHNVKGTDKMLTPEMDALASPVCNSIGENIAEITSAKQGVEKWMNSQPHREAILNANYEFTGFGIAESYTFYKAVQHFCIP